MRVLHIISSLDPASGGPAEALRMMVRFAPPGVQYEVVALSDPDAPFTRDFPCPVHALGAVAPGFGYNRKLLPWLIANRTRFDGAVVHGLWGYVGDATRRALAGHVPYVVFVHGMLDPYFKRAFPLKHAKKWLYWLTSEYWTLRRSARALFTTQEEATLATQSFWLHRWQPAVIALGTEPLPAATSADHEAFFAQTPLVRGRRFLLFLGRIHPKKGVDLLIDAFVAAAPGHPDVDLVIAGPPSPDPAHAEWLAALRSTAERANLSHRIDWPGMVKGAAKRGAFDLCEAFILPSHQENFGVAVAEALAAARPVLLSDKVNIASEIAEDGCGFVERDTPEGTSRLLERWLALSAEERQRMQAIALHSFQTRYDMRRNAEAIANIFTASLRR